MSAGAVLCCGDRNWNDASAIRAALERLRPAVVIHGAARGADSLAGAEAEALGIEVRAFSAEWARYGRGAGPVRNQRMLDEGRPDLVVAFHADLAASRGTADMVRRARKAGLPVEVIA